MVWLTKPWRVWTRTELPTRLRELPEAAGLMRLNGIVLKACEQQAAKRFRSAEELAAALAELGRELPQQAPGAVARVSPIQSDGDGAAR